MGVVILIVGKPETGKTTAAIELAENFLKKSRIRTIFANDRQKEHKYRINKKIQLYRGDHEGWERLLLNTNNKAFCTCFICDEAGDYFLKSLGKQSSKEPMRGKRFNGNIYLINFHDISEIPSYVWRFADYISVGKTSGDSINKLAKELTGKEHIIKAWERVTKHGDYWNRELIKIHV